MVFIHFTTILSIGTLLGNCHHANAANDTNTHLRGSPPSNEHRSLTSDICLGENLGPNELLYRGQYLCAAGYRFGMENGSGTLHIQRISRSDLNAWETVWEADQGGTAGHFVKLQGDGNMLVKTQDNSILWRTHTSGNDNAKLTLFNSGGLRITPSDNASNVLWEADNDPDWVCVGQSLRPEEKLLNGQYICKSDHTLGLVKGRLITESFYDGSTWYQTFESDLINGGLGHELVMQGDGNLVIYSNNGEPLWSSRTNGIPDLSVGFSDYGFRFQTMDGSYHTYLRNTVRKCIGDGTLSTTGQGGGRMDSGESICNNYHYFGLDNTGDLALWDAHQRNEKMWSAGTGGSYGNHMKLENDGSLVVRNFEGTTLWSAGTSNSGATKLQIDDDGNVELTNNNGDVVWSMAGYSPLPEVTCVDKPVLPGQRFDRNEMICDCIGAFGLDRQGSLTRATKLYYITDTWSGFSYNMGGRFGHHAYFQDDGNFVVYSEENEALWSTRTNVDYPKQKLDFVCRSRAICSLEFSDGTDSYDGKQEWSPRNFYCRGKDLQAGDRLDPTEFICSENNDHRAGMDHMGDLGLWIRGRKRTSMDTFSSYGNHLEMQGDGNLVLYDFKNQVLWSSNTHNNPGAHASISDDGVLSVLSSTGETLWAMS